MKTIFTILAVVLLGGMLTCGSYNDTVAADQVVKQSLGDLDASYQRRVDLVPNLVKTVQAAATFEKGTFTEIAAARAAAGQLHITAADLSDPAKMKLFNDAQGALSSSLTKLLAVSENYPQLAATAAFRDLMAELEGTENRIQTARHNVNDAIQVYNGRVLGFPGGFIARGFGYQERAMFTAAAGADKAPSVDFGAGGGAK